MKNHSSPQSLRKEQQSIGFGVPVLDHALRGGLARGCLHEFYAARSVDAVAGAGLALALAAKAAMRGHIIWVRQDQARYETGAASAAGLASLGLNHRRFTLVETNNVLGSLRAALEGARCHGLSCLVMETWGEHRMFDLTASRRLFLAASQSGVTIFILRSAAKPAASSAETRWSVKSVSSQSWGANAPGFARFDLTLLRHRIFSSGANNSSWCVEWNSETRSFNLAGPETLKPPLSRPVVPLPVNRQIGPYARAS